MTRMTSGSWPALAGASALLAALAVEFADELAGGTQGAAMPLIRHDLALNYGQIGLLASVPLLLGSLLELPVGVLAGHGRRRRTAVAAGGLVVIAALIDAAAARSFAALVVAFVAFFPASGAFAGLTQSGLMDADPARQPQLMARWNLAGSAGAVAGPLLLIAILAAGGSWRTAYLALAACAAAAWLGVIRSWPRPPARPAAGSPGDATRLRAAGQPGGTGQGGAMRRVRSGLRQDGVVRWLILLQAADLLLDVLTGFLGVYFVDVVHATPAEAALGVAVRLGAGLAGDVLVVGVLERTAALRLLTASAAVSVVAYPAFLLVPGLWPKLVVLAGLSLATAPWYPVLQAGLYGSLPGQSGVAVTLASAASLAGGAGPLAVGFLAERFGLAWALAGLAVAPVCLLGVLAGGRAGPRARHRPRPRRGCAPRRDRG